MYKADRFNMREASKYATQKTSALADCSNCVVREAGVARSSSPARSKKNVGKVTKNAMGSGNRYATRIRSDDRLKRVRNELTRALNGGIRPIRTRFGAP